MTNLLTAEQASNALRVSTTDATMLDLLPLVDRYIQNATGRDWTADGTIHPSAIAAARMLLVMWYDNPSMIGTEGVLSHGLTFQLSQLEAEALKYRKYEFEGINGSGWICLPGTREGDVVISLVGTYLASGDQSAKFESAISEEDMIKQTYTGDLYEQHFVVILKNPADDIIA